MCEIVHRTCRVFSEHLLPHHVKVPTEDRLRETIQEFEVPREALKMVFGMRSIRVFSTDPYYDS